LDDVIHNLSSQFEQLHVWALLHVFIVFFDIVLIVMASDEFLATQTAQESQRLAGKVLEMIE